MLKRYSRGVRLQKIARAEAMIQKGIDSLRDVMDRESTHSNDSDLFRARVTLAMAADRFRDFKPEIQNLKERK